jgi:hypothetical protein
MNDRSSELWRLYATAAGSGFEALADRFAGMDSQQDAVDLLFEASEPRSKSDIVLERTLGLPNARTFSYAIATAAIALSEGRALHPTLSLLAGIVLREMRLHPEQSATLEQLINLSDVHAEVLERESLYDEYIAGGALPEEALGLAIDALHPEDNPAVRARHVEALRRQIKRREQARGTDTK